MEPEEKKRMLSLRDKYRNNVCKGCRNNYYNFPKYRSSNGDVAVPENYFCWHLNLIRKDKCPIHSNK